MGSQDQLLAEGPTLAADTIESAQSAVLAGVPLIEVDPAHYLIEEELARGGMGMVRRARDLRTGRLVALKELIEPTPQREARLEREARLTAQLQHPSIVPVYEVGRWPGGGPFFAMKLVGGRPLDQVVDEALDPDARLALVPRLIPAVEAIAYAHDNGVIHRDLKPGNLLLGDFGETVVIDWGIARGIDEPDPKPDEPTDAGRPRREKRPSSPSSSGVEAALGPKLTREGAVIGTPAYMSPEQASGAKLDARADVYALGALLYHALSGSAPYDGDDVHKVLVQVLTEPPPPLAELAPGAPRDLVSIVNKAMAREPEDRYPDARALARDLDAFSRGRLVGAYRYSSWELLKRFVRRNRALSVAVVTLLLVAAVGTIATLSANRVSERERERAVAAEQLAVGQERLVHERLAQVHWRAAVRRLQRGDHLGAEVLAAAALVEQPANPSSPHHVADDGIADAERAARLAGPRGTWITARALRFATRERVLEAHEDWLYDILPSADGRWLVTTSADHRALIWDAAEGTVHRTLEGHTGPVFQAALSADGSELATSAYDGTVRTWSFPEGEHRRLIDTPGDRSYGICYAPDGTLVVANASGALTVHDPSTGESLRTIPTTDAIPWRLSCPTDSPFAVLGSTGSFAVVVDLTAEAIVHRYANGGTSVRGVLLGNAGDAYTLAREGEVRRVDRVTGEVLARANIGDESDALALSPDGRFIAVGSREITVFDASTLRPIARLVGHTAEVVVLAFDPSSTRLYSGSSDHTVAVWGLSASSNARRFMTPTTGRIDTLRSSPGGGRLASVGDDGTLRIWDLQTGRATGFSEGHTAPIRGVLWLDESRLMTAAMDRTLRQHTLGAEEVPPPMALPHFGDEIAGNGTHFVVASGDGSVLVGDVAGGDLRTLERVHEGRTWWLGFDPDGRRVATAGFDGRVTIVDPTALEVVHRFEAHDARIYDGSWHPEGEELTTADLDGWVRGWDPESGERLRELRVPEGEDAVSLAWSPDGERLLVTTTEGVRVFDRAGTLEARIDLGSRTSGGTWTDDGRVVFASDGSIYVVPLDEPGVAGDPRALLREAERAAGTTLDALIGMEASSEP